MPSRPRRLAIACTAFAVAILLIELRPAPPAEPVALRVAATSGASTLPASAAETTRTPAVPTDTPSDAATDRCDAAELASLDEAARDAALDRYSATLVERLHATGDPVDRAVAALVAGRSDANRAAWIAQVDAVARSAVLTADSRLYGLAWRACIRLNNAAGVGTAEGCGQLSFAQWLRIDPDNGRLWLDEAVRARQHEDRPAEADALFHASTASRYAQPTDVAPQRLLAVMRADDPAWLRYPALLGLTRELGLSSRWGRLHEAASLSGSCADEALDDPNRRELCTRLANRLLDGSISADAVWPGIMIARELKWPLERFAVPQRNVLSLFTADGLLPQDQVGCADAGDGLALLAASLGPDAAKHLQAERPRRIMAALEERRRLREEEAQAEEAEEPEADDSADE